MQEHYLETRLCNIRWTWQGTDTIVNILKYFTYVVLLLLPAFQVLWEWKFHDRRKRNNRQITRGLIIVWLICGLASTGFYVHETCQNARLQTQIDELVEGKNLLLSQNQQLLRKIEEYQLDLAEKDEQITELEEQAKMAARNITSFFDFKGVRRETAGGKINITYGEEYQIYLQMVELEESRNYTALIELCKHQIEATPDWLTPYLYCGVAYANLGNGDEAIAYLRHITESAPGDPEYAIAEELLGQLITQ